MEKTPGVRSASGLHVQRAILRLNVFSAQGARPSSMRSVYRITSFVSQLVRNSGDVMTAPDVRIADLARTRSLSWFVRAATPLIIMTVYLRIIRLALNLFLQSQKAVRRNSI
jgi:hypothetical protein